MGLGDRRYLARWRGAVIVIVVALAFVATAMSPLPASAARKYASIVVDAESGQVLHARYEDSRRYPASLTKMMTLYLLFDALDRGDVTLGQKLRVSRRAAGQPPSRLGLRRGQTITVDHAIRALVTKSANDVAVVVGEALGGTEVDFAREMTREAHKLGMSHTQFRNASGLYNPHQYTTARDMATLAISLMRDHARYYHYFSTPSFTWHGRTYRNHNKLLGSYAGTDGLKTGYVHASGFNLVASAVRHGRRLVGVVMGGRTGHRRDREMVRLLNLAYAGKGNGLGGRLVASVDGPRAKLAPPMKPSIAAATASGAIVAPPAVASAGGPARTADAQGDADLSPSLGWGIQVGAFHDHLDAERAVIDARTVASDLLDNADIAIVPTTSDAGNLFRARLSGIDADHAIEACRRLNARHMPCIAYEDTQQARSCTAAQAGTGNGGC